MNVNEQNKMLGAADARLSPYEFQALAEGRKYDAMRLYRGRRGVGLRDAKAALARTLLQAGAFVAPDLLEALQAVEKAVLP